MSYNLIDNERDLYRAVSHYRSEPSFSFDVETIGEHRGEPVRNTVAWLSLSSVARTDVIPMGHPNGELVGEEFPLTANGQKRQARGLPLRAVDYSTDVKKKVFHFSPPPYQLYPGEVFEAFKPVFDGDALKIAHNLKFDAKSITKYHGQLPQGPYFDTMIASWLIDTRRTGSLDLASCVRRELNIRMEKGIGKFIEGHTFNDVADYSALDAEATYMLAMSLIDQLEKLGLDRLMTLEMQVSEAICAMELTGAAIDQEALATLNEELEAELEDVKGRVYRSAGRVFNLNSNVDKQRLLFGKKADGGRGLRPHVRTASGAPSVSADALKPLKGKDALVDGLLEYADVNKLMSTYVIPYMGGDVTRTTNGKSKTTTRDSLLINGRIHTDFVQNGAETGRFSSRNPNLQNVPNAKTEHGKAIRNLFCAPDGELLVCADYSQIEPRIIAHFSRDHTLVSAFMEGRDVYTAMAEPLGLDRGAGKLAVLAMSYGIGPDKVESSLNLAPGTGKDVLRSFEAQFADVYKYKRRVVAEAANRRPMPYVRTMFGRRRYLPDLRSKDFGEKSRAERQAFNTLIQGSAADIMKIAIVRAHKMLPPQAHLTLTVHDELLTSCPEDMAQEVAEIIREAMEGIQCLSVPLTAEVDFARTWGEAK